MGITFTFPLLRPKQASAQIVARIAEARARLGEVRETLAALSAESSALDQDIARLVSQRLATGEPSEATIEEKRARRAEIAPRIVELSTERAQLEAAIPGAEPMVKLAKLRELRLRGAAARRELLRKLRDSSEIAEKLASLDAEIRPLIEEEGRAWHEATRLTKGGAGENHSEAFSSLYLHARPFKGLGAMTPKEITDAIRLLESAIARDERA